MLQQGSVATPQPVDQEVLDNETWRRWRTQLDTEDLMRPHRAVRAVLPSWEPWKIRRGVPLTYRMTQILTGHGVFGGIPATNRTRGDLYMSSLQRRGGHGAAYAGVFSSMGGAPEDTAHGDRGENIPGGTGGNNPQGSPRILSRPRLLRASNAGKGVGGERKDKNRRPAWKYDTRGAVPLVIHHKGRFR
jgi:hypothetical protein